MVICDTMECATPFKTGEAGTTIFVGDPSFLGIIAGKNTGTFYTDAMGNNLSSKDDPLALQQYVKPGMAAQYPSNGTKCGNITGWGRKMSCLPSAVLNATQIGTMLEGAIDVKYGAN